jgi:hypothetical protein
MNCHDCEALLQRQLDGETLTGPELDRHLAECSKCRGLFAAGQLLLSGLRRLPALTPPEALTRKIISNAIQDRLRYRRLRWAAGVALAAACLLFTVWAYSNVQPQTSSQVTPVAKGADHNPQTGKEQDPNQVIPQTRRTLDQLTAKMIDKARKEVDVKRDVVVVLETGRIDQSRDLTAIHLARHRSGVAIGLQTVAATTRRGLDFMLRDTPNLPGAGNNEE